MTSSFKRHLETAIAEYQAGDSLSQIAKRYHTTRQTVRNYFFKALDIEVRPRGGANNPGGHGLNRRRFDPHVPRAVAMYAEGHSCAQIAAHFGFEATAVIRHLRRAGVVLRPRGGNNNPMGVRRR